MSLGSLIAAFEQACHDAQIPSTRAPAEESLKSFFSHPDAIPLGLAVTETTTSAIVRFHAAAALRSTARDRWASLQPTLRYGQNSLRYWIINYVNARPSLVTFERRALLRTAAFLTRRAYLEENRANRATFFTTLQHILTSRNAHQHVAVAAIELVDLIVEEFLVSSVSHSALGMEREMFICARNEFVAPDGDMVHLFKSAIASLLMLLSTYSSSLSAQDWESRTVPALSAILKIITACSKNPSVNKNDSVLLSESVVGGSRFESFDVVVVNRFLGREWFAILDHIPALMKICFSLTAQQLSTDFPDTESQVLSGTTQTIIAIAAISQKSYEHSGTSANDVLAELLTGMSHQKWPSCHIALVRVAYAEVWKCISCAYGLLSVESLPQNWIKTFTKETCKELDTTAIRISNPDDHDDDFSLDVLDLLLETWSNFVAQGDDRSLTEHRLSSSIEDIISHLIRAFLRTSGDDAEIYAHSQRLDAEEDLGFEDTSIDDSRLCMAANMARFVLDRLADQIRLSLMRIANRVFHWTDSQMKLRSTLSVFQEDLFFLFNFTCAVLADEVRGEVPSVPAQFVRSIDGLELSARTKNGAHVQTLLHAVMEVAQEETYLINRRGPHCMEASPRVGTAILDGLSRLCQTYLVPVSVSSTLPMVQFVGGDRFVESSINLCFEKATESLLRRGFETDIAESAAVLISHLATGAKSWHGLQASKYWQHLLGQGVEMYQTLPPDAVRALGRSLTTVLGDAIPERLVSPACDALRGFVVAQNRLADAAERAISTVNLLAGVSMSEQLGTNTRRAILQALDTPDGIAVSCARAFSRNRPDVSRSIVSLADHIVYSNLSLLHGDEARGLVTNAVKLAAVHSDIVENQKDALSVDEVASDTEEMIALLTHILEESIDSDTGDACYFGLSKVLLIMNDMLLDLPHVGTPFFLFVTRLVCRYPDKLSYLPSDFCKKILQMIDMQRTSVDVIAERRGLDAITALGRAWVSGMLCGPGGEAMGEALCGLFGSIFNGVATGAAHTSNLEAAADAMLPLIHINISGSVSVVEELSHALLLSSGQSDQLRMALEELARAGHRAHSMYGYGRSIRDMANENRRSLQVEATKSFREAVAHFSSHSRSILLSYALDRIATN